MPSMMATIAITTSNSVSVKPFCRFMAAQCTELSPPGDRYWVTPAGASDGRLGGPYGRSVRVHIRPGFRGFFTSRALPRRAASAGSNGRKPAPTPSASPAPMRSGSRSPTICPLRHSIEVHAMTQGKLTGLRIAILATDGFEQSELTEPRKALDAAGATTEVVSPKDDEVRGWNHQEWGIRVPVDQALAGADARDYDALVLPGGVMNPDALRMQPEAVAFVK